MTVDKLLITQFVNYLNEQIKEQALLLPEYITIGTPFYTSGRGIWFQLMGTAEVKRKYIRGRFCGSLPFSMYYRMSAAELNGIEAKMLIPSENLDAFLSELKVSDSLPQFTNFYIKDIQQTRSATPFRNGEDGTTTYQSIWNIDFEVIKS